jgi:menaquinone-dependent protoporphyrinogen oxidase
VASFLVLYGTGEGQTAKVAERVRDALVGRGHDATAVDAADSESVDVGAFDAAIVGASVHRGTHQSSVRSFLENNREALSVRPTAFFQVSLSSATSDGRERAAGYVDELLDSTGWNPDRIGLFGGALRYSEYGFIERLVMRRIAKRELPDADTAGDTEFTDWATVDDFAADVAAFVEGRLGVAPPAADDDTDG